MILSRQEILRAIEAQSIDINPFSIELLGSSSIGLRLSDQAFAIVPKAKMVVDVRADFPLLERVPLTDGKIPVKKGQVVLAYTLEAVNLGPRYCAFMSGTSDLARLGISVVISNFVGAGFGTETAKRLVLEIETRAIDEVLLTPEMRIGHLVLCQLQNPSDRETDPGGHWDTNEPHSTLFGRTTHL